VGNEIHYSNAEGTDHVSKYEPNVTKIDLLIGDEPKQSIVISVNSGCNTRREKWQIAPTPHIT